MDVPAARDAREMTGLAHVASASFLASRASPSFGFWIALAGGVALARAGQRHGVRAGYGASIAAMLQTVAVIGTPRLSIPLTQALTAPLLGAMEARGASALFQFAVCAAIRLVQMALFVVFAILVLTGLDAYTDFYDTIAGWLGFLPQGTDAALALTAVALLGWAVFATAVQVTVYRRGLRRWPGEETAAAASGEVPESAQSRPGRFDPRAVALASAVAIALLVSGFSWELLAGVAAWLAIASITCRGDGSVVTVGIALALVLALAVLATTLIGGLGVDASLRRAARAGLIVLVATWLRAAAGSSGLREVSRRSLTRMRRLPAMPEAARIMDQLGSGQALRSAAASAAAALRSSRARPLAVVDAVLEWVATESRRFRPVRGTELRLRARARDALLVAGAAAPPLVVLAW